MTLENNQQVSIVSEGAGEAPSAALMRYEAALEATVSWLLRSIKHGRGGSCAYFGIWGHWSKPYPETTGYIIPTLLNYAQYAGAEEPHTAAFVLGEWLLGLQSNAGYWNGGMHPARQSDPSIFNSAQILIGLCALYRETKDERWCDAAKKGALWLARSVGEDGQWSGGNYRQGFNPSYYTRVAWPMLEVWDLTQDPRIRSAAERVLSAILSRRKDNGVFRGWGFDQEKPAFTHTIAYTLRGLLESARLLGDWETYGQPAEIALEYLFRQAELTRGKLAGAFFEDWKKDTRYTCLTGNAQTAICLLKFEERKAEDLRLVNAACKLVDEVCEAQALKHPIPGFRGAVAGSSPVWGRYMMLRYPNWAAKFHADALMLLIKRLRKEGL